MMVSINAVTGLPCSPISTCQAPRMKTECGNSNENTSCSFQERAKGCSENWILVLVSMGNCEYSRSRHFSERGSWASAFSRARSSSCRSICAAFAANSTLSSNRFCRGDIEFVDNNQNDPIDRQRSNCGHNRGGNQHVGAVLVHDQTIAY